jgi:hypothetical protein
VHATAAQDAIEELLQIQSDYERDFEELSERQRESTRGEAMQEIINLQLQNALEIIQEALETELP